MNTAVANPRCDTCGHSWHGAPCINGLAPADATWERDGHSCQCPGPWVGVPEAWLPRKVD